MISYAVVCKIFSAAKTLVCVAARRCFLLQYYIPVDAVDVEEPNVVAVAEAANSA